MERRGVDDVMVHGVSVSDALTVVNMSNSLVAERYFSDCEDELRNKTAELKV